MANKLKPIDEWQLPQTTDDLIAFVRIAPSVFSAEQKIIRAMEKQCKDMGVARDMLDKKKEDLNRAGQLYLDAEVMVGEIAKDWEKKQGERNDLNVTYCKPAVSKKEKAENIGISERDLYRFEKMADNPDCVEQEKRNSEIENRLPTTNGVMRLIDEKKKRGIPVSREEELGYIGSSVEEEEEIIEEIANKKLIDALELIRNINVNEVTPILMEHYGYRFDSVTKEIVQKMHMIQIRAVDLQETLKESE